MIQVLTWYSILLNNSIQRLAQVNGEHQGISGVIIYVYISDGIRHLSVGSWGRVNYLLTTRFWVLTQTNVALVERMPRVS